MTNTDVILEYLDEISPQVACDDCLSAETGVQPRQQVYQICTRLASSGAIDRRRAVCDLCGRPKYTSKTASRVDHSATTATEDSSSQEPIDIEKIRTEVVQMCLSAWRNVHREPPPRSVSKLVCQLRDEGHLPGHMANMILTLCNLRNIYVYENMPLGTNERLVAQGAWAIVQEQWKTLSET